MASDNSVTYAMEPGGAASYPFPFMAGNYIADDSVYNVNDFQYQLYRPLYWFGSGANPYLNPALSLADPPTYRGHVVTIQLKQNYKWSNGEPVDAQDVVFWMNMMIAEGQNGAFWSPKGLPSDVTNVRAVSKYVVTMQITTPQFSESWFTNNELSEITPMPAALGPDRLRTQRLRHQHLGLCGGVRLPELAGDQEPVDFRLVADLERGRRAMEDPEPDQPGQADADLQLQVRRPSRRAPRHDVRRAAVHLRAGRVQRAPGPDRQPDH